MAKEWVMVRLRRETHARLLWVQQLLQEMGENGKTENLPEFWERTGAVPLDGIVAWLLDHYTAYRSRPRTRRHPGPSAVPTVDVPQSDKDAGPIVD